MEQETYANLVNCVWTPVGNDVDTKIDDVSVSVPLLVLTNDEHK